MSRILITGSTDGLGLAAARTLMAEGHEVVLHARSSQRAATVSELTARSAGIVIGDLSSAAETQAIAEQARKLGRMDAVIHNAGVYREPGRGTTPENHAKTLAVNTLAPYILTVLMERPDRLIYLSSGMHRGADGSLRDIDWVERRWDASRAYSESKLYVTALAFAIARHWPGVLCNAVDPGWVPTRMGGPGAPDDLTFRTRFGATAQAHWLDESVQPLADRSIRLRERGELRQHVALAVALLCARCAPGVRPFLLDVLLHGGPFLIRERGGGAAGGGGAP